MGQRILALHQLHFPVYRMVISIFPEPLCEALWLGPAVFVGLICLALRPLHGKRLNQQALQRSTAGSFPVSCTASIFCFFLFPSFSFWEGKRKQKKRCVKEIWKRRAKSTQETTLAFRPEQLFSLHNGQRPVINPPPQRLAVGG